MTPPTPAPAGDALLARLRDLWDRLEQHDGRHPDADRAFAAYCAALARYVEREKGQAA